MKSFAATCLACLVVSAALAPPARADDPPAPTGPRLTRPPKLIKFVEAVYPEDARAAGQAAQVVLRLEIDATGKVTAADVVTSAGPAFDAAAIAAALQFEFEPALVDDRPSAIRIHYQYDFVVREEVAVKTTADLTGVVRDRDHQAPLAGVVVEVGDGHAVTTGPDGRFALRDLPPGRHVVTLSGGSITALQTEEELTAGQVLDVIYEVGTPAPDAADDGDDLEIVVVAPTLERAAASVQVAAGVARKVPGTGGDVLKVVESMPGVARAAAGSSALVVWGAAPQDTRVYVDGVRIPRLYHTGGLRSVIAAELVGGIELVPGGYGVAHGRSLGGLVEVGLAPLDDTTVTGAVASDVIDSSAAIRVPLTERLRLAVAVRRSQLDWMLRRATDDEPGALFPVPQYHDAQARLAYAVSPRARVELGGLLSSDRVERTVTSLDPGAIRRTDEDLGFQRAWLRYRAELDGGGTVELLGYGGRDASARTSRYGAMTTELDSEAWIGGARAAWRGQVATRATATLGVDLEAVAARIRRSGSITMPAREGDIGVFGQPPPDQINFDTWRAVTFSPAPYAEVDVGLFGGRLHVVPGLRLDPFVTSVSRRTPVAGATPSIGRFAEESAVQPRLAVRLDAGARVRVHGAVGRYRQPPDVEDLSAVFGSPTLPIAASSHAVVGATVRWTSTLSTELTGFATRSEQLAVRSASSAPLLAEALVATGTGRVTGAQLLVRRELRAGLFGWVSYSVMRSERTDQPDGPARLFDYDQTHVLTAVASWSLGHGVEIGARVRYATGMPRTAVVGAYFDSRRDTYQPLFGDHNGDRLPAFVQLDARVSKRIALAGPDLDELELYLDLQNATDRANAEEVVYSADFATKGYIRGIPILPVIGARLAW